MTLETFLEELADPLRPIAASKLVTLSNIEPGETARFLATWLALPDERRRSLIEELIDLAEDNVELNFDAVFLATLADADPEVRRGAIHGLWEHDGRDLIDPLLALVRHDPDAGVRAEAALALGRYVLQAEFDTLPARDSQRVEEGLRAALEDAAEVAEVRARALESVGARGMPGVRDLVREAFNDGDRRLRLSAVHAMGRSCDPAWLPTILPELEDEDPEMRYEAAVALGAIEDKEAIEHLAPRLHDEDPQVQEAAITALGEIGGPQAKEALQGLLADGNERLHDAVVEALTEADLADDPLGYRVRE